MTLKKGKEQDGMMLAKVKEQDGMNNACKCKSPKYPYISGLLGRHATDKCGILFLYLLQPSITSSDCVLQTQLPAAYLQLSTTSSDCVLLNTDTSSYLQPSITSSDCVLLNTYTSSYSQPSITSSDCVLQTQIPLVIYNCQLLDMLQQHLRALKSMKYEPDPSFITSLVELKLDEGTLFEWHKHSQEIVSEVPHYKEILDFINLRAQASESLSSFGKKHHHLPSGKQQPQNHHNKVAAFNSVDNEPGTRIKCPVCISDRHPLYSCAKFKLLSHDEKVSVLKKNNLCMNCLNSGHFARKCKSSYRCKKCQKLHHTSLHRDVVDSAPPPLSVVSANTTTRVVSSPAVKLRSSSLLMTSRVLVFAPNGSCVEARALLDNGSTSSFISERLVQSLAIPHSLCSVSVSGIAESIANSNVKSVASFQIASTYSNQDKIDLTAIVLPKVTCDLPVDPVPLDHSWTHLNDLPLADPAFGEPRRVDILLGVDIFVSILCNGRRSGPAGSPVAIETKFGWVVCGGSNSPLKVTSYHASVLGSDDILRKFWELEQAPTPSMSLTPEEKYVVEHFDSNHSRDESGRFVVPLPRKIDVKPIGESRSRALRRFLSLERSLHQGKKFLEVDAIVTEYTSLWVMPNLYLLKT